MDWDALQQAITQHTGVPFVLRQKQRVGGGCINSAYRLLGDGQDYFVKINQSSLLDMFIAEAEGLAEIAKAGAVRVPAPVCYGISGSQAYLVLENLQLGGAQRGGMASLGRQLAAMHRFTQPQFGWQRDNTIGSTQQPNKQGHDWLVFWRQQRLGFQLQLAQQHGASGRLLQKGERLQHGLDAFFVSHQPVASLLHGDLWSGNYSILATGEPVIFDPAVYYGDREADIAMTELFGGFSADFYAAYNDAWPLDAGYKRRKTLYNLYHILNHYNMFGGGYAAQAEGMLDRLLAEI